MKLVVGCPVANRAWALPHWFECLAAQTVRPDAVVMVHSGGTVDVDRTWSAALLEARMHGFPLCIKHDVRPPHSRHDNERYLTLASIRNEVLRLARDELKASLFLSLDSDIMLENPETIERLMRLLGDDDLDVDLVQPVTFFHPNAPATWTPDEDAAWAYNFGFWKPEGIRYDEKRAWARPWPAEIPWGAKIAIDIPMGVWLSGRDALDCRYRWHQGGEDVGFAHDLEANRLRCVVDTQLYARHIWQESDLLAVAA